MKQTINTDSPLSLSYIFGHLCRPVKNGKTRVISVAHAHMMYISFVLNTQQQQQQQQQQNIWPYMAGG